MAIKPNTKTPNLSVDIVDATNWNLQQQNPEHFTMVVFYRGLHCPICSNYLKDLDNKMDDFQQKGVEPIAVSTDSKERAERTKKEWDIPNLTFGIWPHNRRSQSLGIIYFIGNI